MANTPKTLAIFVSGTNRVYHAPPVPSTNVLVSWLPRNGVQSYYVYDGYSFGNYTRRTAVVGSNSLRMSIPLWPAHYFSASAVDSNGLESIQSSPVAWMPDNMTNVFMRGGNVIVQFVQTNPAAIYYVDVSNELTGVWTTIYNRNVATTTGVVDVSYDKGSNGALGLIRIGRLKTTQ